ncbi:helix-turn-helix transcriptional regulator [Lyngbya confervoides]|uniref:AraC family transcriptional regulator n=1 Tax=Lyngbya confervoides BDU141951 TaxID=1574623 RepID=A0ABD4T4S6_9CYAN|nr:AraC family transcriptional regulator [Lyngbya confervoides]MCM1983688.1 AraC family transcriptional regulator [Lyngbya confervoides BDU141951]
MQKKALVLDAKQANTSEQVLPVAPLQASNPIFWKTLHAELHCQPPHETPLHTTPSTVLCIQLGETVEEEWWMEGDYRKQSVSLTQISLYPPNLERKVRWHQDKSFLLICLHEDFMVHMTSEGDLPSLPRLVPQIGFDDPFIWEMGKLFREELSQDPRENSFYVETLALALGSYLAEHYSEQHFQIKHGGDRGSLTTYQIRQLEDYVQARLGEKISLDDMAGVLDMSVFYFSRRFKDTTNLAPYQYVMRARIERSQTLLRNHPELSILEIALQCGFSNPSHFANYFRKWVGVTPRQYRQDF